MTKITLQRLGISESDSGTYNYNRIIYTAPSPHTAFKTNICNTHNGTLSITKHAKHAFDWTEEHIKSTAHAWGNINYSGRLVRHADTEQQELQVFISLYHIQNALNDLWQTDKCNECSFQHSSSLSFHTNDLITSEGWRTKLKQHTRFLMSLKHYNS